MANKSIRLSDGTDTLYPESAQSGSGYQKCADGTLIQWGNEVASFSASGNTTKEVTFQVPFVSSPFVYVVRTGDDAITTEDARVTSWTASKAYIKIYNYYNGTNSVSANWLAIGRWK